MSASAQPSYRERLWPGPLGWSFVVGFAGFLLVALLPVSTGAAVVTASAALVLGAGLAAWTSAVVEVSGGQLTAGRARIPLELLANARALDAAGIRTALGPGSDARTFALLRAWIGSAVMVDVLDPADPTPAWLVSTRHPDRLLAALGAAGVGQAAHSEHTG